MVVSTAGAQETSHLPSNSVQLAKVYVANMTNGRVKGKNTDGFV